MKRRCLRLCLLLCGCGKKESRQTLPPQTVPAAVETEAAALPPYRMLMIIYICKNKQIYCILFVKVL